MSLGNNLLNLRKKERLSQEELADKLNVSRQTISKWETDQSQPDFDKIKPLCEIFHITADELLFCKTNDIMEAQENKNVSDYSIKDRKKKKALSISSGILFYFIGVIWIMISIPVMNMDPIVASSIFLFICGIATFIIVYGCIVFKKSKDSDKIEKVIEKNPIMKAIYMIITLIFTGLYLWISFTTLAWHITWIIWIIYSVTIEIAKLVYLLIRSDKNAK